MKRGDLLLFIGLIIVSAVMGLAAVYGQEPDPVLEEIEAITAELEGLTARTKALREEIEPRLVPVKIPDPAPPIPIFLVDPETGAQTPIKTLSLKATAPFTICADAEPPIVFAYDGRTQTENQGLYCAAGGNSPPLTPLDLAQGLHQVTISAKGIDPFTLSLAIAPKAGGGGEPGGSDTPPSEPEPGSFLSQVGPWVLSPVNPEAPFIDIVRASEVRWTASGMTATEVMESGAISPKTGLPDFLPDGKTLTTNVFFTGEPKSIYDGPWVLTWEGDADLDLLYFPAGMITSTGPNRIEFTRDAAGERTRYHTVIQVKRAGSPITSMRMFRAENETLAEQGRIYAPRFLKEIEGYSIIRTMDMQEANRDGAVRADQISTADACCWGNYVFRKDEPKDFVSMPPEAVAALGAESGSAVWHHAPIMLGAPKTWDETGTSISALRDMARDNVQTILASPEWDIYADRLTAALISEGYPENRPFYTTVSNEVWNYAPQYQMTTNYADGLGRGIYDGEYRFREGYGAALARWRLALDGALKRAGRAQRVVYVVEGQAANPWTTEKALKGARDYLESRGEDWIDHAGYFGISVASYWGSSQTPMSYDGVINGPETAIASLAWILKRFEQHAAEGEPFGVKIIGAYEGGSHFLKQSGTTKEAYTAWHWGPEGARINRAVNDALIERYPGIIISNYVAAGPIGGQPWFDGMPGETNPLKDSWNAYRLLP